MVEGRDGGEQSVVVGGIIFVDVDLSGRLELMRAEERFGRKQADTGHNHEGILCAKGRSVGHLSSEIQAADKAVDFAERR